MTPQQHAFFRQATTDWETFRYLRQATGTAALVRWLCRRVGVHVPYLPVCHMLHYLQMCTEKLAKAYFNDAGRPRNHAAFRRMFTSLLTNPNAIIPLRFPSVVEFVAWIVSVQPIVDALEDLAPSIADRLNLPNPEYPWPKNNPVTAPIDHPFTTEVFNPLNAQAGSGQPDFLTILGRMIETMHSTNWHL